MLCQLFYPELVSTGQTLTELAESLSILGTDVEVCCGPPTIIKGKANTPKDSDHKGISIHRVWGTTFPKLSTVGKLVNQLTFAVSTFFYLLFRKIDRPVLVVTNPPFLGAICILLKKIKKVRFIYLIFDVYPDTAVNLGMLNKDGFVAKTWECLNRSILRSCDAFIVIGRCMADVIRNKMPDKEKETIRLKENVIHVWADDRNIQPSKEDEQNPFLEKWNLEGKFVLGYSGNMGRFHDLETIAEAAKKMKEEDQFRFLFIGEGFKKKWLINYVKINGLSNCIIDTYVPREYLHFVLKTFDLGLVSLSQGQEGLSVPSKTFGLLSAGVPVVAIMNKSSEIALVIEEESCGIVVPPGDPAGLVENILALEQNRERLSEMKSNARKAVDSKYSLEKASQAYFELISQLMH